MRLEKLAFRLPKLVMEVVDDCESVIALVGFECGGVSTGEAGAKISTELISSCAYAYFRGNHTPSLAGKHHHPARPVLATCIERTTTGRINPIALQSQEIHALGTV